MSGQNLFSDFPPVRKTEWLDKIKADLKGRPVAELFWQLADELVVDPFAHPEDRRRQLDQPLTDLRHWWIGASAQAGPALASLIDELREGGVQSLRLVVEARGQMPEVVELLGSRWPDLPHLVLDLPEGADSEWLEGLAFAKKPDWVAGAACVGAARVIVVGGTDPVATLVGALQQGCAALAEAVEQRGLSAKDAHSRLVFRFETGPEYFLELARLRAFALLWGHVLEGWQVAPRKPVVEVHFAAEAYGDDPYHNMIRATTLAMSALLGGADRLEVRPVVLPHEGETPFTRRIARNVQHILQLESHFGKVADPVAGSWYVEQLTDQLARAAWDRFRTSA